MIQWQWNSCFFQKITKNRPTAKGFAPRPPKPLTAGGSAPRPSSVLRLRYTTFLNTSPKLDICTFQRVLKALSLCKILLKCQPATISDLPSYDIFARKKFLFWKFLMTSLHVIGGFGPPYETKFLATPIKWTLPEKLFWRPFFWRTLAAVSFALGLEHSCPWPPEGLFSKRLSLALASDFFLCFWPWPWPWLRALCPRLHICKTGYTYYKNSMFLSRGTFYKFFFQR